MVTYFRYAKGRVLHEAVTISKEGIVTVGESKSLYAPVMSARPGDRQCAGDGPAGGDHEAEPLGPRFRPPLSMPALCVLPPARAEIEERVSPKARTPVQGGAFRPG
jgi:hypothetical protein